MNAIVGRLAIGSALAFAGAAGGSQVQGHLYMAFTMKQANPSVAEIVRGDEAGTWARMYKFGALAPDSAWLARVFTVDGLRKMVLPNLKPPALGLKGVVNCSHNDHALELTLNMLRHSSNTVEAAYALGWVTHWITDSHMHGLINRWGGYFFNVEALRRHKILEAIESKHVLTSYGDRLTNPGYRQLSMDSGHGTMGAPLGGASNLLVRAFRATYPGNAQYAPGNEAAFVGGVLYGEDMAKKQGWLYNREAACRTGQDIANLKEKIIAEGMDGLTSADVAEMARNVTDLPADDAFALITNCWRVTTTLTDTQMIVQVLLQDNKAYGRFLMEWEQAAANAVSCSTKVLPLCVRYLKAHIKPPASGQPPPSDEELLSQIAAALKQINPQCEMDQPETGFLAKFPAFMDTRGYPTKADDNWSVTLADLLSLLWYQLYGNHLYNVTNVTCEGKIDGQAVTFGIAVPPPTDWDAATATAARTQPLLHSVVASVALPRPNAAFAYDLLFRTGTPAYRENTDSARLRGEGGGGDTEVMLGDVFTVELPLPASLRAAQTATRWATIAPNRRLCYNDLAILRAEPWHTAAAAHDPFRMDIAGEEQTGGGKVRGTLQFTALNCRVLLGEQTLAFVALPDGLGTQMEALEREQAAELALTEKLTPELAQQWHNLFTEYQEQLKGMPLTELERLDLLRQRQIDLYQTLGIDIGILDTARLSSRARIRIVAPALEAPPPSGWTADSKRGDYMAYSDVWYTTNGAPATLMQAVEREASETNRYTSSGSTWPLTLWTMRGSCSVSFGNNPELEKAFNATHAAAADETSREITVAGFKGLVYEKKTNEEKRVTFTTENQMSTSPQTEETFRGSVRGEGLLKKGKVFLCLRYAWWVDGTRYIAFVDQVYDKDHKFISARKVDAGNGMPNAGSEWRAAPTSVEEFLSGVKLVPDRTARAAQPAGALKHAAERRQPTLVPRVSQRAAAPPARQATPATQTFEQWKANHQREWEEWQKQQRRR